jgi:hypothetical protein
MTVASPLAPYFAGMNLAIRRRALDELGGFDPALHTGEDIDLCVRGHDSRWELFFEPDAVVRHRNRDTVGGLWRQWFDYGYYHAALFRKHARNTIEVLVLNHHPASYTRYTPMWYVEDGPFPAQVFVTSFVVAHALALPALLLLPLWPAGGLVAGLPAALAFAAYFAEDLTGRVPWTHRPAFAALRYLTNAAIVSGGLIGGARLGFLYVYGTLWRKAPSSR